MNNILSFYLDRPDRDSRLNRDDSSSTSGVHNSNLMANQKCLFCNIQGPKMIRFYSFTLSNEQGKRRKILAVRANLKASAGYFWPADHMLCIPVLPFTFNSRSQKNFKYGNFGRNFVMR